jgi:Family of unknown function (DUF6353)
MNTFLPEVVTRTAARGSLIAAKNSPKMLLAGGIAGVVGSTVLACRATLKLEEVLETAKHDLETAHSLEHFQTNKYTYRDHQKDVSIIYTRTTVKIARLYAPSVVLGSASVAALISSHNILSRRNAALTAAYAAIDKGFAEYRQRVVEKYGEEADRNFRYGTEEVEIINEETGKKETVTRVSSETPSIYARFFDQTSTCWSKDPEYNRLFLINVQNYVNDLLHARGHVFLNEVYDRLGIDRSNAGAVVGWIMRRDGTTDNYIDFGIFNADSDRVRDFVNGREGSILLDFNVDGVIWDKIDTPTEALSWQMQE